MAIQNAMFLLMKERRNKMIGHNHKDGIHKGYNGQYELRSTEEATAAAGREEAVLQRLVQRPDFEKGEEQRARSPSEFKRITTAKRGEGGRKVGGVSEWVCGDENSTEVPST